MGVGLIRRFGAKEPTVVQALLRLLPTMLHACGARSGPLYACGDDPDRWAAVEGHANLLLAAAERATVEPADLAPVHAEVETFRESLAVRRRGPAPRDAADPELLPKTVPPT